MKTLRSVSIIFLLLGGNVIQILNVQERFLVTLKLFKPNHRLDKQSYICQHRLFMVKKQIGRDVFPRRRIILYLGSPIIFVY